MIFSVAITLGMIAIVIFKNHFGAFSWMVCENLTKFGESDSPNSIIFGEKAPKLIILLK